MSFAQERERRSNAGNRMRALLDKEVDMEELFEETESEDEEFEKEEDEPDTVDSDFDINSSEGEQDQEDQGRMEDLQIARAEKQARRQHVLPAAAVATTKPPTSARKAPVPRKSRDRTTLQGRKRQSFRTNTVLNRLQVEEQIKEDKMKRALLPKRDRPTVQRLTQEEMLAEAALTEEENKASLAQWQLLEAEKSARAKKNGPRILKAPFVRYHSIADGKPEERPKRRRIIMISGTDEANVQSEITDADAVEWQAQCDLDSSEMVGRNLITFVDEDVDNDAGVVKTTGLNDRELDRTNLIPALGSWLNKAPRPAKPILCPITGLQARYREPRSLVPYANKEAFKVIQACTNHTMVWSAPLGLYVGDSLRGATGVPDGWDRMMRGKQHDQLDWALSDGSVQRPSWLTAKHPPNPPASASPTGAASTRRTRHRSQHIDSPPTTS